MVGRVWLELMLVKTIVITRPVASAAAFWQRLDGELPGRFVPIFAPLTENVSVEAKIEIQGVGGLVFSSANAVEQFAARWRERELTAWCVGDATRDAAVLAGFKAVSAGGNGADLENLIREKAGSSGGKLLHIRGVHSTGLAIPSVVIYDQVAKALDTSILAKLESGVDVVTFFSPRAALLFGEMAVGRGWNFVDTTAVCFSAAIAAEVVDIGFGRVVACDRPNMANMLDRLRRLV